MAQPAPHLHLAELTATQFMDVWRHFDSDGNGYIEGQELENFLEELETARKGLNAEALTFSFQGKMHEFMQKFDENSDGKIEMLEVNNKLGLTVTMEETQDRWRDGARRDEEMVDGELEGWSDKLFRGIGADGLAYTPSSISESQPQDPASAHRSSSL
ncbi:calretinin-like [Hoplias malabaricus]|uniref:calretinin-like n=1 Tax=Hoplias malabaricus TaxID=27720 RepID=UPI0034618BEF